MSARNVCACADCVSWRATHPVHAIAGVPIEPPAPDRADELQEALQRLVDVVDRIGGYLSSEDQATLWRARELAKR